MNVNQQLVQESSFSDLKLYPWLVQQCAAMGLHQPTPVQYHCIPPILEGRNCISESQTGTGKTLAFALPILQDLSQDPYGVFAVVITPTRELAYQISQQFRALGGPILLKVALIVGGEDMIPQAKELSSRPHVVIATPGRLLDHLGNDKDVLKKIKYLVLDESDRLLEGNFVPQLQDIFKVLPKNRQTLLFSATMSKTLDILKSVTADPFIWSSLKSTTVEKLEQKFLLTEKKLKDANLVYVIQQFEEKFPNSLVMMFTRTCKSCQHLSTALNNLGFTNVALNSSLPQRERVLALSKFKSGTCKLLIATDVASRGLDIPTVDLVINYNVPSVAKDYVHRVGRTARAGRSGLAITLVTPSDIHRLRSIEEMVQTKLADYKPAEKKVLSIAKEVNMVMRETDILLEQSNFDEKKMINKKKKAILEGTWTGVSNKNKRKQKILNKLKTRKQKVPKMSE